MLKPSLFAIVIAAAILMLTTICSVSQAGGISTSNYDGRSMLLYVPTHLPAQGSRALVVVLHGGLGSAQRIESMQSENGLNMDTVAEKNGFIVAYLNGTPVLRRGSDKLLGWNAGGGCCGMPARNNIDDVGYITGAIHFLIKKYGINQKRIFGMGHSNGAMMTQRVLCEAGIYEAAMPISGPLNIDGDKCPAARGKRILAIHGVMDENVPITGGRGTKGISRATYKSEDRSQKIFTSSGASYKLQAVSGADHKLDNISAQIQKAEGLTIAEKATKFFGLAK